MTENQKKEYGKSVTLLAAYLQLVHLQAEAVLIHKHQMKGDMKQRVKMISNHAKTSFGNLCNLGGMDRDSLLELAGLIDDGIRPNVIEDDNKTK